jgi:hypothetical protein
MAAKALFIISDDREEVALARTRLARAMGSTGKSLWPTPDKGLKERIHRIGSPGRAASWPSRGVPTKWAF